MQLSPFLIGAIVTLLIVFGLVVVRVFVRQHFKAADAQDNSKQSSSLLCAVAEVNKVRLNAIHILKTTYTQIARNRVSLCTLCTNPTLYEALVNVKGLRSKRPELESFRSL